MPTGYIPHYLPLYLLPSDLLLFLLLFTEVSVTWYTPPLRLRRGGNSLVDNEQGSSLQINEAFPIWVKDKICLVAFLLECASKLAWDNTFNLGYQVYTYKQWRTENGQHLLLWSDNWIFFAFFLQHILVPREDSVIHSRFNTLDSNYKMSGANFSNLERYCIPTFTLKKCCKARHIFSFYSAKKEWLSESVGELESCGFENFSSIVGHFLHFVVRIT